MISLIKRILRLQPGEARLVFLFGFLILSNSLARQLASIVGISGFLDALGADSWLIVICVDYLLVLITGALASLIVDRINRVKLLSLLILSFAVIFVVFRLMFAFHSPGWLVYAFMIITAEQQFVTFPLIFWVLVNDTFSMAQAKRIFPVISGFGFAGLLIGIGMAAISPIVIERLGIHSEDVLLLNVIVYLIACLALVLGLRKVEIRKLSPSQDSVSKSLSEGWDFVRGIPSFRYLMYAILALALGDTIIEFRFLGITEQYFSNQTSYQEFYSLYILGVTLLALIIQTFLTSRIINRMELKNTFFFFPTAVLIGALGILLIPGMSVVVAAMLLVKLTRDTLHESSLKSFLALVPEERRGRVGAFVENYLIALGTILAAVITGLIILGGRLLHLDVTYIYLSIAIFAGGFAIWAIIKLRSVYDSSMLNWRLKRRQRGKTSMLDKLDF